MPVPDAQVDMQIGGVWTDISSDVYGGPGIMHTRGRSGEGARVDPATVGMELKSPNGKYDRRNPASPNFGRMGPNTPVRASVAGATALRGYGGTLDRAVTPDTAALDIVGDLDVRVDAQLDDWHVANGTDLMGKWGTAEKSWLLCVLGRQLTLYTSSNGTTDLGHHSTVELPAVPGGRLAVRATLDVNNGSGGHTVVFYTAPTMAGPWTQLGSPVVTSGTIALYSGTASLYVVNAASGFFAPTGVFYGAEVRSGIGGTVVANPDFRAQTIGATSFADAAGRTWSLTGAAAITDRTPRLTVEVPSWSPRFTVDGADMSVPIQGGGILRRLGQGAKALDSTLRRRIPTYSPLAYWPMEEGETATQAYSPIAGVNPMTVTDVSFASDSSLAGSGPLPTLGAGGRFFGGVRPGANGQWQVELVYNLDALPATLTTMLLIRTTRGTTPRILVQIQTNNVRLVGQDADGNQVWLVNLTAPDFVGQWNRLQVMHSTSGGTVTAKIGWVTIGEGGLYGQTTYSGTAGHVTSVEAQPGSALQGMGLGHVSVFAVADLVQAYALADHGFSGETAGARLVRLAAEEGVPFRLAGAATDQTPMGPQRPDTLVNLLTECEAADGGILYEDRNQLGLVYRGRTTLYNQTPALVLPYSKIQQPFEPTDDDQRIRNDVTRSRPGGSSARVVREDGPLSVQPPPVGVGTYDEAVSVNVDIDDQLEQIAGWAMHLTTWDEPRYKQLRILLHKHPDLIPDVAALDIGSIIRITDLPSYWPPGPIDLMVEGYREDLTGLAWEILFSCSPAGPWSAGVVESSTSGRPDTDGCTLTGALTTTATSVAVTSSPGPRWIDSAGYAAMFPFDVTVGGEVMRVTACTGTGLAQTFTVTRSINGVIKAHDAGSSLSLTNPMRAAL
ncbi:hypothetical protein ABT185_07775 [Streptomyces clavifer]|uniref:hypothetical protein n=1 Tax=Streptomyces clavifer TaxID=68188 RepID=UPI0033298A4A